MCRSRCRATTPSSATSTLLDPLADEPFDPAPLAEVLADPDDRDRAACRAPGRRAAAARCGAREIHNVFDTQVAAGFAGMRAQLSYEGLLREVLGVRLRKTASFTRWDRAAVEPRAARVRARGRAAPARARDGAAGPAARPRAAGVGARGVHVPGAHQRRPRRRHDLRAAAARELAGPRRSARSRASWSSGASDSRERGNRPGPAVLQDATLVEVAKRRPQSSERLSQIRGLHESTLRRRGRDILEAVARGRERDGDPRRGRPPDPARCGRRAADRAGARRWCARGPRRRSSPTSCSPRARTCSASSPRCATPTATARRSSRRAHAAGLAARGRRRRAAGSARRAAFAARRTGSGRRGRRVGRCMTVDEFEADISVRGEELWVLPRGDLDIAGRARARGDAEPGPRQRREGDRDRPARPGVRRLDWAAHARAGAAGRGRRAGLVRRGQRPRPVGVPDRRAA